MTLLDIMSGYARLKRVSTHNTRHPGPEYASACPFCGEGEDRFHFWPEAKNGGYYWCRVCDRSGDAIGFLMDLRGSSYFEACRELGLEPDEKYVRAAEKAKKKSAAGKPDPAAARRKRAEARARHRASALAPAAGPAPAACRPFVAAGGQPEDSSALHPFPMSEDVDSWLLSVYSEPPELWQEKAARLAGGCAKAFRQGQVPQEVLAWLEGRGIPRDAAEEAGIGWHGEDKWRPLSSWGLPEEAGTGGRPRRLWIPRGLMIPVPGPSGLPVRIKIRRLRRDIAKDKERGRKALKYVAVRGSSSRPLVILPPSCKCAFITEAELDAVSLARLFPGLVGAVGLGSLSIRPDAWLLEHLSSLLEVHLCLDNEQTDAMSKAITAWQKLFQGNSRLVISPVPEGKDPGEAYGAGVDMGAWMLSRLCPRLRVAAEAMTRRGRTGKKVTKGRFGPALNSIKGSGRNIRTQKKADPGGGQGWQKESLPAEVRELLDLLKEAGAGIEIERGSGNREISVTITGDAGIEARMGWQKARRLSELVFINPVSASWVFSRPEGTILPGGMAARKKKGE